MARYALYIGRFQPYHLGHQHVLEEASKIADKIIVALGSANRPQTFKDPFTISERKQMIPDEMNGKEIIKAETKDYATDGQWILSIQDIVDDIAGDNDIVLVGYFKDATSYYLRILPFTLYQVSNYKHISATKIRNEMFENETIPYNLIPQSTKVVLDKWIQSETFKRLQEEYQFIKNYKKQFECCPFPPVFTTTDAVVYCKGHILLVKRKFNPGKGLWALPGGFVNIKQTLESSCLRELKEETGIKVNKNILRNSIKMSKVFDNPSRSLRGRTITHAFYIHLTFSTLPELKASTDAKDAQWIPVNKIYSMENQLFEDHFFIIDYFMNLFL